MKDSTILLKDHFKLSLYEARAYVALLQGASDPKSISRVGRIPLPRIYDTLGSLEAKGFALKTGDNHIPVEPKIALEGRLQQFEAEFHNQRSSRIKTKDALLRSLKIQHKEGTSGNKISLMTGINSIANKFSEVVSGSNSVILTVKKAFEARHLFLRYLSSVSSKEKKKIRIIVSANLEIPKDELNLLRGLGVEIRKREDILLDLMVSDTDDVMIGVPDPLSEETYHAVAIWTRNSSFASSLRDSLDELWERSRSNGKGT